MMMKFNRIKVTHSLSYLILRCTYLSLNILTTSHPSTFLSVSTIITKPLKRDVQVVRLMVKTEKHFDWSIFNLYFISHELEKTRWSRGFHGGQCQIRVPKFPTLSVCFCLWLKNSVGMIVHILCCAPVWPQDLTQR